MLNSSQNKEVSVMATINYEDLVKAVVDAIGGAENISSVSHCATRLRFVLKDEGGQTRVLSKQFTA